MKCASWATTGEFRSSPYRPFTYRNHFVLVGY